MSPIALYLPMMRLETGTRQMNFCYLAEGKPMVSGVEEVLADKMNVDEASRFLGLCRKHLTKLAKKGEVPSRRLGARLVFSREALKRWLAGSAN